MIYKQICKVAVLTAVSLVHGQRTTWQQEAQIMDPTQECAYYDFPALDSIRPTYPPIWEIANLQGSGITPDVKALFSRINSSIPTIAPRGDPSGNGDWLGQPYDGGADPDCWWSYTGCTTPKIADVPVDITSCLEPLTYGLSIDDGPNCSNSAYYDFLTETQQKATLFYIGSNVINWPLQAQHGLGDGHDICVHTWSHKYMTSLTNEEAFAELYYTKKAIKDVLGITVRCWRPPFGDVDDRIRFIAEQLDLRTIIWSEDTDDWNFGNLGIAKIEQNYQAIISNASSTTGVIVLSHELNNETMSLSEQFLPQIQKTFTGGVMPINVCNNNTRPYMETDLYVYPDYAQWASGTRSVSLAQPTAGQKYAAITYGNSSDSSVAAAASSSPSSSSSSSSSPTSGTPNSSTAATSTRPSASAFNAGASPSAKVADAHSGASTGKASGALLAFVALWVALSA